MEVAGGIAIGAVLSYLLGAIPFGFLVGLLYGLDIRKVGSGNTGATNLARALGGGYRGLYAFAVVSVLDVLKGFLPTFFLPGFLQELVAGPVPARIYLQLIFGLATITGHIFSVYLRLRGGKAVNTSLGVVLALAPMPAFITLGVWVIVFIIWRYVSLASIIAAAVLPLALMVARYPRQGNRLLYGFCVLVAVLVIVRHVSNIRRLIKGTENRMGGRTNSTPTG